MAILTEEQSMLRDAARGWVQEKAPVSALRKLRDSQSVVSFDPAAFAEVAQMGWAGVVIPEAYGGSEFGYLSLGLVLEEMGKTLAASPLLASALTSASAIVLGGTDTQKEAWLPKIASGALIATLAVDEGPRHDPVVVALKATQSVGLKNVRARRHGGGALRRLRPDIGRSG
jgi:alkylation response protein AidB-like acyl-CoA dehydrogenase